MTTIVSISDDHRIAKPLLPKGDILIHAGDWCHQIDLEPDETRDKKQLEDFSHNLREWRKEYEAVIAISGNHDWIAQTHPELTKAAIEAAGATYLNDSGASLKGFTFWGSPIQPWFKNLAFNRKPEEIGKHWQMIPSKVDVLITHGPPRGILDQMRNGIFAGCDKLLSEVISRIKPKLHVFGHIHEGYGEFIRRSKNGDIHFVNASLVDHKYDPTNAPIVVEI